MISAAITLTLAQHGTSLTNLYSMGLGSHTPSVRGAGRRGGTAAGCAVRRPARTAAPARATVTRPGTRVVPINVTVARRRGGGPGPASHWPRLSRRQVRRSTVGWWYGLSASPREMSMCVAVSVYGPTCKRIRSFLWWRRGRQASSTLLLVLVLF